MMQHQSASLPAALQEITVHQTIASSPELVLSSTSWLDQTNKLRKFCDTRLSVNQLTTRRWTMRDDLMQFPQLGVCGIGLWRWKIEDCGVSRTREFLARSGLRPTSLSFAGGFAGANGMTYREAVQDAAKAVRLAAKLGCRQLLVTTGARGNHVRSHVLRTTRHALRKLGDYAAAKGVVLAFLPMKDSASVGMSMVSGLDEGLDVIGRVNHPAVKLAFHTCHMADAPDLLSRIPDIVPHVASVHVSDVSLTGTSQVVPGNGRLPLPQILRAFDAAGYRGAYELNIWSERVWASDYSTVLADSIRYFHEHALRPLAVS